MLMKLYKWKNITNKIICDKNARIIQKFIRKKMGKLLWKKRVKFFSDLSEKYFKRKVSNFAKIYNLDKINRKLICRKLLDNLRKINKKKTDLLSLNDNIIMANDEFKKKNKEIALKNILKLYTYIVFKKLFENLNNLQRNKSKIIIKEFMIKLKQNVLKKSEYTYEKKISNETIPFRKKLSFSRKKSSNNIPKKEMNKSIPYISILPHLIKFLQEKIHQRKNYSFNILKQHYKNNKLYILLTQCIKKSIILDKQNFINQLYLLSTNGQKQKDLFELLRKYFIKRKLFLNIEKVVRILDIIYLIKVSIINQEISDKRWMRVIIRKWRFLSFSHNISKKKMSILYKNFHINYLEMVNDVFGEERLDNPSVIKEFERFGANVGMWENKYPDFDEESKYCNVQKKFLFHRPIIKEENKEEVINNYKNIKEEDSKVLNTKIDDVKEEEKVSEIKEDKKEDNIKELKEKQKGRFYWKNFKKK